MKEKVKRQSGFNPSKKEVREGAFKIVNMEWVRPFQYRESVLNKKRGR